MPLVLGITVGGLMLPQVIVNIPTGTFGDKCNNEVDCPGGQRCKSKVSSSMEKTQIQLDKSGFPTRHLNVTTFAFNKKVLSGSFYLGLMILLKGF